MEDILTKEELECARSIHVGWQLSSIVDIFGEWKLPSIPEKESQDNWRKYLNDLIHRQKALQKVVKWESGDTEEATDSIWTQLEEAAKAGNEQVFLTILKEVNWDHQSAENFIHLIKLALKTGAHLAARQISIEGLKRYSTDPDIQKYARGLAPPKVIARNLPPNPTLQANREWLRVHSERYRGKWVAIRNGELLGTSDSMKELTKLIPNEENILYTKVR